MNADVYLSSIIEIIERTDLSSEERKRAIAILEQQAEQDSQLKFPSIPPSRIKSFPRKDLEERKNM